jgi:23S rRNA (adenine2503-C2)-methyltransferase
MYQPGMKKENILGWDKEALSTLSESLGEPPYRGRQLFRQLYTNKTHRFAEMTDLSKGFRGDLDEKWEVRLPAVENKSLSQDGTIKVLFGLADGHFVESVYIPESNRGTLCISSQVGCDVGCTFCLTARMGFLRNLTSGEIIGQVLEMLKAASIQDARLNIVFMGMGEPLYNYQNVMKAFRLMIDPDGLDLSYRRITLSTAGVVPVLEKMYKEPLLPNLAISLNATDNETRSAIMPVNQKWDLKRLIEVCRSFPLEPRRRITFEYVLLAGVNDGLADAKRLAQLLKGMKSKVNLIPYNENPGLPYRRPGGDRLEQFREALVSRNISAFVRRPRGDDISAACGQLAYLEEAAGDLA